MGDANGPFSLGNAGILGGTVTTELFDSISGSFDVNIPVGQSISLRLEPGNGGYNERVDLGVTVDGTGGFQNVTFNAADATDASQKTTFVNTLNSTDGLGIKFVFQINNQAGAVGSDFVFDNLTLTSAVPEPSTALFSVVALLGLTRRKR
ncbi:MAG: hypothetical protein ACON5H_03100 [Akkermansiaceae bacterium]